MTTSLNPRICIKQTVETPPCPEEEALYDFFQRPPQTVLFKERIYSVDELAKKIGGEEYLTPSIKAAAQAKNVLLTRTLMPYHHLPCYVPTISFLEKIATYYAQKYKITIAIRSMSEGYSYVLEQGKKKGPFAIGLIVYMKNHFHVTPLLLHKTQEQAYAICVMDCVSSTHVLKDIDFKNLLTPQEGRSLWISEGVRQADNYSCRLEALSLLKHLLLWIQRNPEKLWSDQVKRIKKIPFYPSIHFFYLPSIWTLASQSTHETIPPDHPQTTVINNKGTTYERWMQKYRKPTQVCTTIIHPTSSERLEHSHTITLNTFLMEKAAKYVAKILHPTPVESRPQ